jgi:SsrA-binding protein
MRSITKHKSAHFDYDVVDIYDTGIVLVGHEVKACKTGKVNISDGIIFVKNGTLQITNMDIPLYERTSPKMVPHYQARGTRNLLINKKELAKIVSSTAKTGNRIIPLELRETSRGRLKLKIGIAKLRKKVEKKSLLKEKDQMRDADRQIKEMKR